MENKPRVSKYLLGFYGGILVVVALIFGGVSISNPQLWNTPTFPVLAGLVLLLLAYHVIMIQSTRYYIQQGMLVVRSLYGTKRMPLSQIKEARKILIPFGIRLFGSSFHAGYFYVPSLGKVFMAITNFQDGVLVDGGEKKFIISPSRPETFLQQLGVETTDRVRA